MRNLIFLLLFTFSFCQVMKPQETLIDLEDLQDVQMVGAGIHIKLEASLFNRMLDGAFDETTDLESVDDRISPEYIETLNKIATILRPAYQAGKLEEINLSPYFQSIMHTPHYAYLFEDPTAWDKLKQFEGSASLVSWKDPANKGEMLSKLIRNAKKTDREHRCLTTLLLTFITGGLSLFAGTLIGYHGA